MSIDLTTFDPVLKELYTNQTVEDLVFADNPFIAMVPKFEAFMGRNHRVPVRFGNPQNVSADAATAFAGTANSKYESFDMTRVKMYGNASIDGETLRASKSDKGAFIEAVKSEFDGAINSVTRVLAQCAVKEGWGDVGRISTIVSTTITLTQASDAHNFEIGQVLYAASTQAGSTLNGTPTGQTVTAVDRSLGTVTISANNDTLIAGDWLFIKGNRHNSATPSRLVLAGLGAWLPTAAPASTAFFGVDRSVDTRLGGLRLDATSGYTLEEALIEGDSIVAQNGGRLSHYFMNPRQFAQLNKSLQGRVFYNDVTVGNVGFRGIQLQGQGAVVTCFSDPNISYDTIYGLNLKSWTLGSMGPLVQLDNTDGSIMQRVLNSDSYMGRVVSYGNLWCRAPGQNIRITV